MKTRSTPLASLIAAGLLALAAAPESLAQPAGRGNCNGAGARCGSGPDISRSVTVEGTTKSFTGGRGEGRPLLVLATPSGDRQFVLAPWRALAAADAVPAAGTRLAVKAAPVTVDGAEEWVALWVTDLATGKTTTLRDAETGLPLRGQGRGRGPASFCTRIPSAS